MRLSLGLFLFLGSCATADPSALYGTWKSDEALTLEQVAIAELTLKQREFFEQPDFFGGLRVTYEQRRVLTEYQGSRAYAPYKAIRTTDDSITIEHMDPLTGENAETTVLLRGDQLWFPVRDLGFYEVFTKVECAK